MTFQPPAYLSPSSISTFQQCPLKFKFSRIDRLPEPPTRATLLGNFVHEVLEEMYGLPNDERIKDAARSVAARIFINNDWVNQITPYIDGVNINSERAVLLFKHDAWRCIDNLWIIEDPIEVEPDGLEYELIGEIDGVSLKGFIDRFTLGPDDSVTISDYKTGKTPKEQFANQKFFQLLVYANLIAELGVGSPTDLELLFLESGRKFTKSVTPEDLKATRVTIRNIKDAVDQSCATGEFVTQTSKLCDWCTYKSICPAWGN